MVAELFETSRRLLGAGQGSEVARFVARLRAEASRPVRLSGLEFSPEPDRPLAPPLGVLEPYTPDEANLLNLLPGVRVHPPYTVETRVKTPEPAVLYPPVDTPGGKPKRKTPVGKPRCCVRAFEYPKSWCTIARKTKGGVQLGVLVHTYAEFAESGATSSSGGDGDGGTAAPSDPGLESVLTDCKCYCCEFAQYIRGEITAPLAVGGGEHGNITEITRGGGDLFQEDCASKGASTAKVPRAMPETPITAEDAKAAKCYGQRSAAPHARSTYSDPSPSSAGQASGDGGPAANAQAQGCKFNGYDSPGHVAEPLIPGTYSMAMEFMGRIEDACNDRRPVVTKTFKVEFSLSHASGQSEDEFVKAARAGIGASPPKWSNTTSQQAIPMGDSKNAPGIFKDMCS